MIKTAMATSVLLMMAGVVCYLLIGSRSGAALALVAAGAALLALASGFWMMGAT